MAVNIRTTSGYLHLDSWILANIIHLGTIEFCRKFLNNTNDPGGRQYAQMVQAARSAPANIAEGASRWSTSYETMMKLTDVARATINELSYDFLSILLLNNYIPWSNQSPDWMEVRSLRLERPNYSIDLMHDVGEHILQQKSKFDKWLTSNDIYVAANALIVLCGRLNKMLKSQLNKNLKDFESEGGFTENMTASRLTIQKSNAEEKTSPVCPDCGKIMIKRVAKKGRNSGHEFWSCSDYPNCRGTRPVLSK